MRKLVQKARRVFSHPEKSQTQDDGELSRETTFTDEGEGEKHGLFTLVDKPSSQSSVVDIVALHGLNGHYRKTWCTQLPDAGSYNWLENDLAEEIPNARIMSYGYNSKLFSNSVADIADFADLLLEQLLAKRPTPQEGKRPLLFLCHSLGGLVFKKALIRARERDRYEELLRRVRGVAFFGTPHRGSSLADWTSILTKVVRAVNPNVNTKLIENLKARSQVLFDISESFVDRGKSLTITSFYETEKLCGYNFQVVSKDSALLLLSNELAIPLPGDHRSICRFSNTKEDRQRLELVLANLKEMVQSAAARPATFTTRLSEQEQRECIQNLYPGNYESFKDLNVNRTPGTCEWLLQHHQYKTWRVDENSSVLWLSANAGCGKSTLAKYLVDHLRSTDSPNGKPESVCHFFFKEGIQKQQSTVLAMRAILHQIFTRDKALMRHLFEDYELKGNQVVNEFDTLFKIFRKVVQDPESPTIICVFDGGDECPKSSMMDLLSAIDKLIDSQADIIASKKANDEYCLVPNLKIMILSRPENFIKNSFKKRQYTIRLKGENETKAINHDVWLVIQQCVNDLQDSGIPPDVLKDFSKGLEVGADSTFLWVTLMIKILKDRHDSVGGTSQKELVELLRGRDIFAVYKHMLEKIISQDDSRKMLKIIMAAQTPLSIEEISIAIAASPSHSTLEDMAKDLKHPREDYVKALCGHFVRFIQGKVYLVHQTAREFLLQKVPGQKRQIVEGSNDIWQHSVTIVESHRALLRSCICYMRCGERSNWENEKSLRDPEFQLVAEENILQPLDTDKHEEDWSFDDESLDSEGERTASTPKPTEFQRISQSHPFFEYAASTWALHFDMSELNPDMDLFSQVMEFCWPIPASKLARSYQ